MSNYLTTDTELTSIANAIRTAGGTSASLIYPSGFISAIQEIQPIMRTLTINENTLQSQSIVFNAQQGTSKDYTINATGQQPSTVFPGPLPWTIGDTYNINGNFTVTQGENSSNIVVNTDFTLSSGPIELNFSYTGSDLIQKISIYKSYSTAVQLSFYRKNTSANITVVGNFEVIAYAKGYDVVNLNLIDIPWALTTYKSIALNNAVFQASDTAVQSTFNTYTSIFSGAFAFRRFNATIDNSIYYFSNVTNIDKFAFYGIGTNTTYYPIFSFPEVTLISDSAFYSAYALGGIYAPKCSMIYSYTFYSCNNLSEVNFPSATAIRANAFYSCGKLTTANFPKCEIISDNAFSACQSLTSASFPLCTQIYPAAFYSCYNLNTINFPECSKIWHNAFRDCSALTSINFPKCEWIGNSAFVNCVNMSLINIPLCTEICSNAFGSCHSLTSINLPECVSINYYVFQSCNKLISINLPKCGTILDKAFLYCSSLQTISLPKISSIGAYVFQGCQSLSAIYLMGSSVVTVGVYPFWNTPMQYSSYLGYFGSIYVPASLLASYKTATNWTQYSSRMVGI